VEKKIEKLQEMIDVQGAKGNWDYDPYMHGMLNGMLFSQSVMTGEDPVFRDAPSEWLCSNKDDDANETNGDNATNNGGNEMTRPLDNTNAADAKAATPDIKIFGNPDAWRLVCKASSESQGWMKSTKVMLLGGAGGAIVQVTTQHRNPDGSWAIAEAVTWVPYFNEQT